ncbi:hypothetical protein ACFWMG_05190 [Streptomyces sp. NPDC127074]|uniref:hypothetical protein n=1 Tax=Streptomyces sp. NPDC127074 TaxID=3347130 RepID=UPI0036686E59
MGGAGRTPLVRRNNRHADALDTMAFSAPRASSGATSEPRRSASVLVVRAADSVLRLR